MKICLGGKSVLCLAVVLAFITSLSVCNALSTRSQEKQAHKMHAKLAKYPAGILLHLYLRDGTETTGKLGALSDASFGFTNSDSNFKETHTYSDVTRAEKGKEYIGEGSTPRHRFLWIF